MKQLIDEITLKLQDLSSIEKIYWCFFNGLVLYVSYTFDFLIPGVILCFGVCLGVLAFENKEVPIIIISLLIVVLSFVFQMEGFKIEHRPYLGIKRIDSEFLKSGIEFDFLLGNDGDFIARNLKLNFFFQVPGIEINNPENNQIMGVVFPKLEYKVHKTLKLSSNISEDIYFGKKKLIVKILIKYDGLTSDGHVTNVECEYDFKRKTFVYNNTEVDI